MTAERWQRIKAVFQIAVSLEPVQRAAYLDQACEGESGLRLEVESLLDASGQAEDFIEKPALHHSAAMIADVPESIIGRRVGPYRITGEIGRGGMGEVYKAVRDDDHFRQQVAIKIVKRGMDTDYILRRFRNERQILAGLEHPNIARLLDGGATDDGLPYYVMEFIEGQPIDDYCNAHKLTTAGRLRVFLQVCAAVQFAHQKSVAHRDIKPGNILITPEGVPKLLDFGIAKILDSENSTGPFEQTLTQTSLRMMTPAYASPEQVRGQTITPASDVYSLGVLLYELLTLHRPYDLKGRAPHEMAQLICELDPAKPSTAAGRAEGGGRLRQSLEGDLDSIVLTAMRKDLGRRYGSAQAFADDIQRHLDGLPVLARSDTAGYRLGKWVERRKKRVAVAAAFFVVAGILGWQTYHLRAPAEHTAARLKARPSIAVLGFKNLSGRPESAWLSTALTEMLGTEFAAGEQLRTVPGERVASVKRDLSLAEGDSFGRDTLTRLRGSLGADYVVVGSYLASDNGVRLDVRLQDAMGGETLVAASESGREADLPALVARVGARVRERLGVGRLSGQDAERTRAASPSNANAARLYSEGLQRLRIFDTVEAKGFLEKAAAADPNHALSHSALAMALSSLGDDAGGKREAKMAFDLSRDLSRENRLFVEGRYYETINAWEKAVGIYQALFGFFPDSLDYGLRLAAAQSAMGKGLDALHTLEELRRLPPPERDDARIDLEEFNAAMSVSDFKRALAGAERAAAKGEAQNTRILVARARNLEGDALAALDQRDKAIQRYEESKSIYAEAGVRRGVARALNGIADVKMQLGEPEAARKLYGEALEIFRQIGNQTGIASSLHNIAVLLKQRGDFEEAKKLYREALAIRREIGERPQVAMTLNGLANALLEQGELGEVKQMYSESLSIARETGDRRMMAKAMANLGEALRNQGELAAAKSSYQESIAIRRQIGDEAGLAIALLDLGELFLDQGELLSAKNSLQESMALHRKLGNKRGIGYSLWGLGLLSLTEGDLRAAKAYQQESLSVRGEIGETISEAQSRLALADVNFELGFHELTQMFAGQAASTFRARRTHHLEASADATLALALAARRKFAESQKAIDRTLVLLPRVEFRQMRISSATTVARAGALIGKRAEAVRSLEALLAEANQSGVVPVQLEIRLALGEIEMKSGETAKGRARLSALRAEAAAKGYGLIARKAGFALTN